ncbi:MAG: nucleoside-diphosphate kinase [Deltaproteobacteria bacterium]|nr:MAG: nucleoside-diphosphate kinase [Deltaproteobacteria bacterium]
MKERTLSIIKPDGVRKGLIGEVIRRFEKEGLKIVAMKMVRLDKEEAEGFYAVHRGKPFFESLTTFMSSGPIVVMVLEGEKAIERNRQIMGATDPQQAEEGTIRRMYADNIQENIVHGSDAPETATFEISYFFSSLEIV